MNNIQKILSALVLFVFTACSKPEIAFDALLLGGEWEGNFTAGNTTAPCNYTMKVQLKQQEQKIEGIVSVYREDNTTQNYCEELKNIPIANGTLNGSVLSFTYDDKTFLAKASSTQLDATDVSNYFTVSLDKMGDGNDANLSLLGKWDGVIHDNEPKESVHFLHIVFTEKMDTMVSGYLYTEVDATHNQGSYGSLENTNFTGTYAENELHIYNADKSVELLGYLYGNVFNGTAIGSVALSEYDFFWYTQKE